MMAQLRMRCFAADPKSVSRARHYTGSFLRSRGLDELVEDGELITSELVTNAYDAIIACLAKLREQGRPPGLISQKIWVHFAVLREMVLVGVENQTLDTPKPELKHVGLLAE